MPEVNKTSQPSSNSFSPSSSELFNQELQNLKSDASDMWKELFKNQFVTLSILREWLTEGRNGQERFLCLASTLPFLESSKLILTFHSGLTKNAKDVVIDVNSRFRGYSYVLNLHREVQDFLSDHAPGLKGFLARNIFLASEEQLLEVIFRRTAQERALLLSSFPTSAWKRLLERAAEMFSADVVADTLSALVTDLEGTENQLIPSLTSLENELAESIPSSNGGIHKSKHLLEMAGSSDELSQKLKTVVSLARKKHPRFAIEWESRTVTMDHVLQLDRTMLAELLDALESEQIAQLMASLEPQKRNLLASVLNEKIKVTASADFKRFARSPSSFKRAEMEGQKIQGELVQKLRTLAAEGIVELPNQAASRNLKTGA